MASLNRALFLMCLTIGFVVGPSSLRAENWDRFHGPNGTGASEATSVPARWTDDDYNFRISLPGWGHSSPVVWGSRVFLLSTDPDQATLLVLGIDALDGEILWQRKFPLAPYPKHQFNSFASSTPTVDQHRVYVAWASPRQSMVMALDHAGNTVWQQELGPYVARHGFGTSPVVYDDLVILSDNQQGVKLAGKAPGKSFVVALDRETGRIRWKIPRQSSDVSYSSPCVYQPDEGPAELILCSTAHGIFSLNPKNGHENWSIKVFRMRTVSSPLVAAGLIFGSTGSGGGGNYVVAVRPGNPPREVYRIERQAPYVPTSVARGDLVFLWSDGGVVTCVHVPDGKVVWRHRVGGNYFASPVRVGNRLYGVSKDGEVVVLAAEPTYQLLGRNSLGQPSRSTPAVANGRMYLRTESHLMSVGGTPAGGG